MRLCSSFYSRHGELTFRDPCHPCKILLILCFFLCFSFSFLHGGMISIRTTEFLPAATRSSTILMHQSDPSSLVRRRVCHDCQLAICCFKAWRHYFEFLSCFSQLKVFFSFLFLTWHLFLFIHVLQSAITLNSPAEPPWMTPAAERLCRCAIFVPVDNVRDS